MGFFGFQTSCLLAITTLPLENPMITTAPTVNPAMATGSVIRSDPSAAIEELRALRLTDNEATNNRIENMSSALMRRMEHFQQNIEASLAWVQTGVLNLSCAMQNLTNPMENQPAVIPNRDNVGTPLQGDVYQNLI